MKKISILLVFILVSCSNSKSFNISNLEGYWEIYQVEKEGVIIKEYTISSNIDYFKIHTDSSGFRKKVAPQLDGSFIVSKSISNFKIDVLDDDTYHMIYKNEKFSTDEIIKDLSKTNLVLLNSDGLLYKYKRFEKFDLVNE